MNVFVEPLVAQIQKVQLSVAMENSSDSDFIVKTLVAASESVINSSSKIVLTEKQFDRLEEYLGAGYQPSENQINL